MSCCKCEKYGWKDIQPTVFQAPRGKQREYCVFHAPSEHKSVSNSAFTKLVEDRIKLFDNSKETERVDDYLACNFAGTIFPHQTSFELPTNKPIILEHAKFRGNARFEGENFNSSVYFSCAIFYGNAWFQNARFNGFASFVDVVFKEQACFNDTTFCSITGFDSCAFLSETTFTNSVFSSYTTFTGAKFLHEKTQFAGTQFFETVNFDYAAFKYNADFSRVNFFSDAAFSNIECNHSSIRLAYVKPKHIANIRSDEDVFHKFSFSHTDLEGKILPKDAEDSFNTNKEQIFRLAKKDAAAEHDQASYSNWHYLEKSMRLAVLKRHNPWFWWIHWLGIYAWSSGYGEKWKPAATTLRYMLYFCLLILALGGVKSAEVDGAYTVLECQWWPLRLPSWEGAKNVGTICLSLLKYLLLIKEESIEFKPIHGAAEFLILLFTRLVIPIQAAFFAIALRNAYRR